MNHFNIKPSFTDRSITSLNLYLKEIAKYPILSLDEEEQCFKAIKEGDKSAVNALINSNLRFVVSIAKQYQGKGVALEDLISEGTLGLIHAVEKYNPDLEVKFISYAVWWIRQSILQALFDYARTIKLPTNRVKQILRLQKLVNQYEQINERTPSYEEMSTLLEVNEHDLEQILKCKDFTLSLDQKTDDETDIPLSESIASNNYADSQLENESLQIDIQDCLNDLSNLEKIVLNKLFGLQGTEYCVDDLTEELNLTKERILQIKNVAINKLRKNPKINNLKKYLG